MSLLVWKAAGILELEDLTSLAIVPILQPRFVSSVKILQLYYKVKDNPIIKSFSDGADSGSVEETITKTLEYSNYLDGPAPSDVDIRAPSDAYLLVVCYFSDTGNGSGFSIWASTTADTANGDEILKDVSTTGMNHLPPPIPIILPPNRYLTIRKTNGDTFNRSVTLHGYTVELPSNFTIP